MTVHTQLRRQLAQLCMQGSSAKAQIDLLEGTHETCPKADLEVTFGQATTEQLCRLQGALAANTVIKHSYVDRFGPGEPKGCLMYHLFGWTSNEDLWRWEVNDSVMLSASRTMRRWDYGTVTPAMVITYLERELGRRQPLVEVARQTGVSEPPVVAAVAG